MTPVTESKGEGEVRLQPVSLPVPSSLQIRHLMLVVLLVALALPLAVAAFLAGLTVLLVFGVGGVALIVIGSVVVAFQGFRAQRDALLWALAVASERGMPLAPALYAVAEQGGLFFRNRAVALADTLNWGAPVPEALDRVPGVLSREAEILARVGYEAGALPAALRAAAAGREARQSLWGGLLVRFYYLLWVLISLQMIVGFIMYFIIPKFEAIFRDFGVPLPQLTIAVIEVSHFVMKYGFVAVLVVALELFLIIILPLAFGMWMVWTVPGLDRLFLRRHTAIILRALACVVEAGKPLSVGFRVLARRYPATWVRYRLWAVGGDIDRGTDWCEALALHGLISEADAAVLDSARRVGNLSWALRETAEGGERRLAYRLQTLLQILFPVAVMGLGFLVFTIAVAYFAPLISLIQRLAG